MPVKSSFVKRGIRWKDYDRLTKPCTKRSMEAETELLHVGGELHLLIQQVHSGNFRYEGQIQNKSAPHQ